MDPDSPEKRPAKLGNGVQKELLFSSWRIMGQAFHAVLVHLEIARIFSLLSFSFFRSARSDDNVERSQVLSSRRPSDIHFT